MGQVQIADAGKVVPFRPGAPRARKPSAGTAGATGTVLLFTGVRYERDAAADGPAERNGARS